MKIQQIFSFFPFLLLLPSLLSSLHPEPSFSDTDDDGSSELIERILTKYDPIQSGFYSKENYKKLFIDLIYATVEKDEEEIGETEKMLIKDIIVKYIEEKPQKIFSYEEVVKELESEELMGKIAIGMQNLADNFEVLQRKKGKNVKNNGKNGKKVKNKKKIKGKNQKKNKGKNQKKNGENCDENDNGQCPLPEKEADYEKNIEEQIYRETEESPLINGFINEKREIPEEKPKKQKEL